jgi:hypothetical protein
MKWKMIAGILIIAASIKAFYSFTFEYRRGLHFNRIYGQLAITALFLIGLYLIFSNWKKK